PSPTPDPVRFLSWKTATRTGPSPNHVWCLSRNDLTPDPGWFLRQTRLTPAVSGPSLQKEMLEVWKLRRENFWAGTQDPGGLTHHFQRRRGSGSPRGSAGTGAWLPTAVGLCGLLPFPLL
ncbi:hypothetical protein MUG91_G72n204, partial [Manis pentadactyla]